MDTTRVPHVVPMGVSDDPRETAAEFERLRAAGHEVITDETGTVLWFLTADDTEALLTAPEFGAGVAMAVLGLGGVTDGPLHDLWSQLMFGKDGAEHQRLRGSVARRLTPRAVERLRPDIERMSGELLDGWVPGEVVDVWTSYAVPLPARAACLLVGIPDEDSMAIGALALRVVRAFGVLAPELVADTTDAAADLVEYLDELIAAGGVVAGSVLDALLGDAGAGLTPAEVRGLAANLVFGGLDATAKAITTGLSQVLTDPGAWSGLVTDPSGNAPKAVAELLRYCPPAAGVLRMATAPTSCRGTDVGAFQVVGTSLDAACRDPSHGADMDQLDLTREPGKPYAFGAGSHYCLGANLAKLVLQVAFRDLATRFPGLELAADPDTLPWTADPFRGIVALPVLVPSEGPVTAS